MQLEELQGAQKTGEIERNYQESLRQIAELKQAAARSASELRAAREQLAGAEELRAREAEAERQELDRRSQAFAQLEGKSRDSLTRWESERRQL